MSSTFHVPRSTFQITKRGSFLFPRFFLRFPLLALLSVSIAVSFFAACGRKTTVRPPELVAPKAVNDLTLEMQTKGVVLRWGRTDSSVDGEKLDDLAGFVVLRAKQDEQGKTGDFTKIATIPVEDRDRFRKNKKFTYTDEQMTVGSLYRYRVLAFTLDGYYGSASNTVEIVWKGGA